MRDFRNLIVWNKAHSLVIQIYQITAHFPSEERYILVSQMRRAAISIPTNISEGCGRKTRADYVRFLTIASGSATELEYLLLLSKELQLIEDKSFSENQAHLTEVRKMLYSMISKLDNFPNP